MIAALKVSSRSMFSRCTPGFKKSAWNYCS